MKTPPKVGERVFINGHRDITGVVRCLFLDADGTQMCLVNLDSARHFGPLWLIENKVSVSTLACHPDSLCEVDVPKSPPDSIYDKACQVANAIPQWDWPDDDWKNVSDDWDMNLYRNDKGQRAADLYPVVGGNTQTQGVAWAVPVF